MQPSGNDDLASSNRGQFKWKARKQKIVNQSENDKEDDTQSKESLKNDQKHSFPDNPKEDSDRLDSVPLEQVSKQADKEIKGPLTHEDDILMNSEILALIEDVEVKSDRLKSVPKLSDQISGQADQDIKEPLTDKEDVCESEESLRNSEILALIEDVVVKPDRFVSVPNLSDQISGEVDQELKEPLTYESDDILMNPEILALIEDVDVGSDGVNKSEDSSMNSEILAMIEDVEVESDCKNKSVNQDGTDLTCLKSSKALKVSKRSVSAIRCFPPGCGRNAVPLSKEEFEKAIAESKNHCSSCCSTEPEEPLTYESDNILMNPEILALIEDVEVGPDGVNKSEDSSMNSEILAMIEDVEVESDYKNKSVNQDGTDLTSLKSSKASKVSKRSVSAIRCFPPGRGRNAVPLSKEEFEKAIAESKNHCSSCCSTEPEEPLTYESDNILMNPEILALIEDVEVGPDSVNKSEDSSMNSEILAMIEDVEVESDCKNKSVNQDGTDLTSLKSCKALKVSKRSVSAIRCFPPGCGRNAVPLSKEEFEKAIAESKNHCLSCCSTEPEEPFLEEEESEQEDEGKEKKNSERS